MPVVVLKNFEIELSCIPAELIICLNESCFPDRWMVSSVVLVLKNMGERSTAKNYCPVSLLSVVSKIFQKFVINQLVNRFLKYGLFSVFQYGFKESLSTADLQIDLLLNAVVRSGSILGSTFLRLHINDLPDDVVHNIAIYATDTIYSKCDQASDLWQQLELAFELEFDLQIWQEVACWFQCQKNRTCFF